MPVQQKPVWALLHVSCMTAARLGYTARLMQCTQGLKQASALRFWCCTHSCSVLVKAGRGSR
jgi:hypothetical protein